MESGDTPFFISERMKTLSTNSDKKVVRNNMILNLIREHAPITPYALTKKVKWSYTEVCRIIRDLEYVGLIQTRVVLGDNNKAKKLITVPDHLAELNKEGEESE